MRLAPATLAVGVAAGLLTIASAASARATPAPVAADEPPTYVCNTDMPAPKVWPPMIFGHDCHAIKDAPVSGTVEPRSGPVKILIAEPRFAHHRGPWLCRETHGARDEEDKLIVRGRDCLLDEDD